MKQSELHIEGNKFIKLNITKYKMIDQLKSQFEIYKLTLNAI